jgi:hypothetical protein
MDTAENPHSEGEAPSNCVVLAEAVGHPNASQMVTYDTKEGFVFSVGSIIFGGSLVVDPILQRIVRNVLDECLLKVPSFMDDGAKLWLRDGILALEPGRAPAPVPPHGPLRDMWLILLSTALTEQLSDEHARASLRRTNLHLIAEIAKRAAG